MGAVASQITSLAVVYSTIYSGADQRKHQSSASLTILRGIYRWPVNSLHNASIWWRHHVGLLDWYPLILVKSVQFIWRLTTLNKIYVYPIFRYAGLISLKDKAPRESFVNRRQGDIKRMKDQYWPHRFHIYNFDAAMYPSPEYLNANVIYQHPPKSRHCHTIWLSVEMEWLQYNFVTWCIRNQSATGVWCCCVFTPLHTNIFPYQRIMSAFHFCLWIGIITHFVWLFFMCSFHWWNMFTSLCGP